MYSSCDIFRRRELREGLLYPLDLYILGIMLQYIHTEDEILEVRAFSVKIISDGQAGNKF